MNHDSPGFWKHKGWVDDLVTTPSPAKDRAVTLTASPLQTDHVLRSSKSFAARSYRSRPTAHAQTFGASSGTSNKENESTRMSEDDSANTAPLLKPPQTEVQVLGQITGNSLSTRVPQWRVRRSPTPSLRKKRAEAIVKAHGSPTHVRVTAGGRIVPSEQSPLCHPRYGYSAMKANGGLIKFAPCHPFGKAQWTTAGPATEHGCLVQDLEGRICQVINGQILPLTEVNGALHLHAPATNLSVTSASRTSQPLASRPSLAQGSAGAGTSLQSQSVDHGNNSELPSDAANPSNAQQQSALQLEYNKLEQELKELDRAEVIHGRSMGKVARDALVSKRRELVTSMDKVRKAIKNLKELPPFPSMPDTTSNLHTGHPTGPQGSMPSVFPYNEWPSLPNVSGFPHAHQHGAQNLGGLAQLPQPYAPEMFTAYGMNPIVAAANMFVPPPPLDDSIGTPYLSLSEQYPQQPVQHMGVRTQSISRSNDVQGSSILPQSDGSRSIKDFRDHQLPTSPRSSHALPIKDPLTKEPGSATKLNPMSPVYTPGGNKSTSAVTKTSTLHNTEDNSAISLSPLPAHEVTSRRKHQACQYAISPSKKNTHVQSSSMSSYNTADFFPNDTQEYSTRHHHCSAPKQRPTPVSHDGQADHGVANNSDNARNFGNDAPPVPPGTPVDPGSAVSSQHLSMVGNVGSLQRYNSLNDPGVARQDHNISPKNKRQEWLFINESPTNIAEYSSSSPDHVEDHPTERCVRETVGSRVEESSKSQLWREGFHAGLNRETVRADRSREYLKGYCSGLLNSNPVTTESQCPSKVSGFENAPSIQASQLPTQESMPSRSSSRLQVDRRNAVVPHPTLETSFSSSDTFKEAYLAPKNENAILTPAVDGPHVNQMQFRHERSEHIQNGSDSTEKMLHNLRSGSGTSSFPFPSHPPGLSRPGAAEVTSTDRLTCGTYPLTLNDSSNRQHVSAVSGNGARPSNQMKIPAASSRSLSPANTSNVQQSHTTSQADNRISSMTSIDSNLYRQYPGHRVFSPHLEWKSASSVAQAAGFASGSFAPHPQVDGAFRDNFLASRSGFNSRLTQQPDAGIQQNRQGARAVGSGFVSPTGSRFYEGSIDGMSSPPMSPPTSPKSMPAGGNKKASPSKSSSPAKHKFEQIAGKVGIKVTTTSAEQDNAGEVAEPTSPSGKRRWRDLWKNARKDGV